MDRTKVYKAIGINKTSKLATGLILALFSYIAGSLFVDWYSSSIDFLHLSEKESYIHYAGSLVRDIGLWLAAALLVISTLINFSSESKKWVAKLKLFCAIGAMLAWSFGLLYAYYQMVNINGLKTKFTDTKPNIVQEVQTFIRTSDMNKLELETTSKQIAKTIYLEIGQALTVYSVEKGFYKYEPTEDDIKNRLEYIQAEKLQKHMENGFYSGFVTTLLVLLSAVSIGLGYNKFKFSRWL